MLCMHHATIKHRAHTGVHQRSHKSIPPVTRTECERLEGLKPLGDVHALFSESVRVQVQQQGVGAEARAPLHVLPMD